MNRQDRHFYAAVGFILASIIVAAALYDALRASFLPADGKAHDRREAQASTAEDWLVGSWVMVPKGGEDGGTRCADFENRFIYALNRKTAKIMTFDANGAYRDLFAYTIPSGEQHITTTTARWQRKGSGVMFKDAVMRDAFVVPSDGPYTMGLSQLGDNVLLLGDPQSQYRYVRCIGPTRDIYGDLD